MMRDVQLDAARAVLSEGIEKGDVPGAVAVVRWRDRVVMHEAMGASALEPTARPMELDTVFDLASLTKPLATTPVVLRLIDHGLLDLDAAVGCYLPEFSDQIEMTVQRLLTHTSGLPAWHPVYVAGRTRPEVLRTIASLPMSSAPNTKVEYSCLGFIVLGILAEQVTGSTLDTLAADGIFRPLGLRRTGYHPAFPADSYAMTERGNAYEQESVRAGGHSFHGWRASFYPGLVHDGNAHYAMGGISGNSGLFGSADEVAVLGQMWLNGGELDGVRILSPSQTALAVQNWTPGMNEARGLGWKINDPASGEGPRSSGNLLSAHTFGHTGFTGTSLWVDPDTQLVVTLLTNGVHPSVPADGRVIALRARFHDAVACALSGGI